MTIFYVFQIWSSDSTSTHDLIEKCIRKHSVDCFTIISATGRPLCVKDCQKFGFVNCGGCEQWLCKEHFIEHRHTLNDVIDQLSQQRNEVCQQVIQDEIPLISLLRQIDSWEKKAIEYII